MPAASKTQIHSLPARSWRGGFKLRSALAKTGKSTLVWGLLVLVGRGVKLNEPMVGLVHNVIKG